MHKCRCTSAETTGRFRYDHLGGFPRSFQLTRKQKLSLFPSSFPNSTEKALASALRSSNITNHTILATVQTHPGRLQFGQFFNSLGTSVAVSLR
jgi:hypothetical protein